MSPERQDEKVLLTTNGPFFFSIYTIYECLSRRKNSLPTFVSKAPIVPVMDSLLSMLARFPSPSKLITEHT